MLVNVGVDPLKHHRDLNILMTTERTDSLSYAGVRENLVLTLDQVTLNSWNEVLVNASTARTRCSTACATTSTACRAGHQPTAAGALLLPQPRAVHRAAGRGHPRHRATAADQGANHRYLIQVASSTTTCWNCCPARSAMAPSATLPAAARLPGRRAQRYSPLHLDPMALEDHDLALILPRRPARLHSGVLPDLRATRPTCTCWMSSTRCGSNACLLTMKPSLLVPLQRFLQSMLMPPRCAAAAGQPGGGFAGYSVLPVAAFRHRQGPQHRAAPGAGDASDQPFYDVQAIIQAGRTGRCAGHLVLRPTGVFRAGSW